MKTKHNTYWVKLWVMKQCVCMCFYEFYLLKIKHCIFLTVTCEYTIYYKNVLHACNLVAVQRLPNTWLEVGARPKWPYLPFLLMLLLEKGRGMGHCLHYMLLRCLKSCFPLSFIYIPPSPCMPCGYFYKSSNFGCLQLFEEHCLFNSMHYYKTA
jgi:hypothetical protein